MIVATSLTLIVFSLAHGADWLAMHGMHDVGLQRVPRMHRADPEAAG